MGYEMRPARWVGAAAFTLTCTTVAHAQKAANLSIPTNESLKAATPSTSNEDIIVTVRKRAESLSKAPISVVVLKGDELRNRGLNTLEDIATVTPGVSFREDVAGRAGPALTIRGIGYDDYHANGSPSAAVHIDEVYQGSNAWISGQLFDIDHVEVLKGPQGTLFGQNTTAGAVNILTRQPGRKTNGYLNASYGSYNALRVEGAVGGPLTSNLSARIAFLRKSGGGFLKSMGNAAFAGNTPVPGHIPALPLVKQQNDYGDDNFWGVRGKMVFQPSDKTRITAQIDYGRDQGANTQTSVLGQNLGFSPPDSDPYKFYANVLPFIDSEQIAGKIKLEQDLGGVTLTAIAAQQHLSRNYLLDPGSPLRAFDILYRDKLEQTTLEARLANKPGGRIDWIIGAFYFRDRIHSNQNEDVSDLLRSVIDVDAVQHRQSAAAFGEANWHVTRTLTATLGLRYTHETASYKGATVDVNPYGTSIVRSAFPDLPVIFDNHFTNDNVSGRAMLSWRPVPSTMVYGSASRGYKSGGFDGASIFTPSKALPFRPEYVWAYEVGAKYFPRGKPYNFSISGFYDDFRDMQATAAVLMGGAVEGITTNVRTNVASAALYGGEFQAGFKPLRNLDLTASIALLHSEIQDVASANSAEAARREGRPLPNAPGLSFTLGASYHIPLVKGWTLTPATNFSYTASQYKDLDHFARAGSYALLDGRLALETPDKRWSLSVWGRNLTNRTYFVGLVPSLSSNKVTGYQRIVGRPRTIGGEISYRF